MTTRLYYLWFLTVILAFMLEFLTPRVLALLPPYWSAGHSRTAFEIADPAEPRGAVLVRF